MLADRDHSAYISIKGLRVFAHHGVYDEEKADGQVFVVNARLFYDMSAACRLDRLEEALDYADCCALIHEALTEKAFDLIEAAADHVCRRLLLQFPPLLRVEMELCKPCAPVAYEFSDISVNISRSWHRVFLSVGSNMGDRRRYIEQGIEELLSLPEIRGVVVSELVETEPYGYTDQGKFLNGALELETIMEPVELLEKLHELEGHAGRERSVRWGPRTLDLDIIFYDKMIYESERLVIPHIDLENRRFVLEPLSQLAPYYRHPISQLTVKQLLERLCIPARTIM